MHPLCFFPRLLTDQGAIQACNRLAELQEFRSSQTVKVNPDRPQQQARFVTLEVSWLTKPFIKCCSFPFQGAFAACSKLTELQVFTHTAEVKVDPDKPLEGARLSVLEVALRFYGEGKKKVSDTKTNVCFLLISCNNFSLSSM